MDLRLSANRAIAAIFFTAALLGTSGCPTQPQLDTMPGLEDVDPTGPEGKKCYDECAQQKVQCYDMCPTGGEHICQHDCVAESKLCLVDCPELLRPTPPKQ
jgi:hypothetical protein